MLPVNWPRWIVAPIGFALALVSIGLGLILVLAVQASAPYPEPPPTPPRLAYAAPLSTECTACHINKERLGETVASEEERQRLFIEPSQTESLHGRLGCLTCHQGTPDTEDITAAHTGVVADPSLDFENCLLCHRDLPDEFPDDNLRAPHDQVVHSLAENLTCSDCHGAAGHGYDPVSGEVIISMAACLECHKERNLDVQCNVCHTEAPVWSPDMDCTTCHNMVPYVESLQDASLLAYAHTQEGLVCLDCHEEAELQQVHEGAVPNTPIQPRLFEMDFCFDCHVPNEHTSYEEIIERTKDYTVNPHESHYGEMECSICHRVHEVSEDVCAYCHDPIATGVGWTVPTQLTMEFLEWWYPDMDCAFCHVSYTESMQDATLLAYGHAQEELVCLDCHELAELEQVHEEAKADITEVKQLAVSNEFCFGCHVPNEHASYEEIIEATEDYTVGDRKINPHASEIECSNCHSMHKESPAGSSKDACLVCHGPFDELIAATDNYTWPDDEKKTSPHRYVPHDSENIPECIYCHEPHPVPLTSTEGLPEPNPQWCYSCHHERVLECRTCHL